MTVGLVNSHYVEIRRGLHEGDQVIYAGQEALKEGDPVVATEWGPSGPLTLPPAMGEEKAAPGTVYTCPMHPEVQSNHPGKCPKCGMDLVSKPASVQTGFQGQAQAFQSSTKGLGMLLALAILVVYIVLGILYESFFHPLTTSSPPLIWSMNRGISAGSS